MTPVIEVRNLTRRFGDVVALDDISLDFHQDAITGLLGRNGAGKTVLMSLITAHDHQTRGTVRVFGEDPRENSKVLGRTCFIRDNQRYPDEFKLRNVLDLGPHFYPEWDAALATHIAKELDIPTRTDIRKLSRGQLSAAGVLIGMASRAAVTFFDEPYLGLDATARTIFYDLLLEDYAEHPRTIILSTHLIDEMEQLLEHIVVLDHGRVRENAHIDDLQGRAIRITGAADAVDRVIVGAEVLRHHAIGGKLASAVVTARNGLSADADAAGLVVEAASIHELVAAYGLQSREGVS